MALASADNVGMTTPQHADGLPPRLVLGSTSPYRRELLARLGLPFECRGPGVDEAALPGEPPIAMAQRLARAKAEAVSRQITNELPQGLADDVVVIGSDQVADLNGQALGKPGSHARAVAQLQAMRGHSVRFHTAVCVCRARTGFVGTALQTVTVRFRTLSDAQIERYLLREQPYDCAGSAKAEGLGIVLLDAIESQDPTALIGLPLIDTARLLRQAGLDALD